ncbi:MAG: YbaN family protein [Treponema sp.]|nr:YbaN family protein [Treponema sp.]
MKIPEKARKTLFIIAGTITLILGTLGRFVPLLPTTPFYLLTAWLYLRGSERMYNAVMRNKYFGRIVRDFTVHKSISMKTKVVTLIIMWASMAFSAIWAVPKIASEGILPWVIRLVLLGIGVGVTIHILSYKTRKKETEEEMIKPIEEVREETGCE